MRILALAYLAAAMPAWAAAPAAKVTLPDGKAVTTAFARTAKQRTAALAESAQTGEARPVLFDFSGTETSLENLGSPGDLALTDNKGVILAIRRAGEEAPSAGAKGCFVLQLASGQADAHGLVPGARLKFRMARGAAARAPARRLQTEGAAPAAPAAHVDKDVSDQLSKIKGTVPDAVYQKFAAQSEQVAAELKKNPDESPTDAVKNVTGVDFAKYAKRKEELRAQNPNLTEDQVNQRVAAEMMQDLKPSR